MLAATQKPSSDVVPTSIRDLFGYRLGVPLLESAGVGHDPRPGLGEPGVLRRDDRSPGFEASAGCCTRAVFPIRMRSFWLDDDTIRDIAARATAVREQEQWRKQELLR